MDFGVMSGAHMFLGIIIIATVLVGLLFVIFGQITVLEKETFNLR